MSALSTRALHPAALALCLILAAPVVAAAAQAGPISLGAYKGWKAYTAGEGSEKTCFVLGQPRSMEPKSAKRDPVYFLVSDWPARKIKAKGEAEVLPGYTFKDGSKVTVEVGADKFTFFTKNEGSQGAAWVQAKSDEVRLIEALRRGTDMVVAGTSHRGTMTHDTYALAGFSEALDKIHTACGI